MSKGIRHSREEVAPVVERLLDWLGDRVPRVFVGGSWCRGELDIGDLDCLVLIDSWEDWQQLVADWCAEFGGNGKTKAGKLVRGLGTVLDGVTVEVEWATAETWGAAAQMVIGPAMLNVALRSVAKRKGLKLSQRGLVDRETGELVPTPEEEDVWEVLGLECPRWEARSKARWQEWPESLRWIMEK